MENCVEGQDLFCGEATTYSNQMYLFTFQSDVCFKIQIKCICFYSDQMYLFIFRSNVSVNIPIKNIIGFIYHLAKNLFCREAAISQSDICSHSWLPLSPLVSNIRFQMFPISDIPFKYLSKLIPSPSAKSLVNWSGQIQLII